MYISKIVKLTVKVVLTFKISVFTDILGKIISSLKWSGNSNLNLSTNPEMRMSWVVQRQSWEA